MSKRLDFAPDGAPGEPLLTVDGIETYYGNIQALKGISFKVAEGSIVTLLGANGAGKSTTLKSISGLVPPARGTVAFRGRRIDALPSEKIVRLGISHVPEGRELFPELTVLENLKMGAYTRTDKRAIGCSLEQVQAHFPILAERRLQLAGTLSGGEQQMLAIGRALMSAPRLLLVDEPSVGLAPILVSHTISTIKDLKERYGLTVLMAEQNFHQAIRIADRGYLIVHGEIVFDGGVGELEQNALVKNYYLGA